MRLESERVEAQAREEALRQGQLRIQQLQDELESGRLLGQHRRDQEDQEHEVLRSSLEEHRALVTELRGSLEQEKVVSSNLRMELQIERSRCEALIAQERSRTSHALEQLEDQRTRCAQLTDALTQGKLDLSRNLEDAVSQDKREYAHKLEEAVNQEKVVYARKLEDAVNQEKREYARKLEEAMNQEKVVYARKLEDAVTHEKREYARKLEAVVTQEKTDFARKLEEAVNQEKLVYARKLEVAVSQQKDCTCERDRSARRQDEQLIAELQSQLDLERRLREEQSDALRSSWEQAAQAERRLEHEDQVEGGTQLHAAMEGLQAQRLEVARGLEAERQRAALLQGELDALREKMSSLKEKERLREEHKERQRRLEREEQGERERQHDRTSKKLLELQQQRAQDLQRIRQLQQTLADLEEKERQLTSRCRSPDLTRLNQQQLCLAQQQLQRAAVKLRSFLHGPTVRKEGELVQSEDGELRDLLRTLTGLDEDLKRLCSQSPSQMSPSLVERLLKENSDLTIQLAKLSEDKVTLKHTVSCLEKELQNQKRTRTAREQLKSPEPVDATLLSEKLAWQKERVSLQTALRKAEAELSRVTAEIENRPLSDGSSSKVARLYGKYLRAESFRKALVYQKKYLLLLLGGFQDCEQVTLSLIARMGIYPSPADLQAAAPRSRPINRFRTAVRVVIAISRLRFLVRKWQKASRKCPGGSVAGNGHGQGGGSGGRTEALRQQHPGALLNSPPTRDSALSQRTVLSPLAGPLKSPFRLHNRLYPSPSLMPAEGALAQPQDPDRSLHEYIQHLEAIQLRLGGVPQGSPAVSYSRKSDR